MKIKNKVIGLAGVAGSGKDLFFELLNSKVQNLKRYALADKLKADVFDFCIQQYDIDPLKCSREKKNMIRPFLVAHGNLKRKISEGRHWVGGLTKIIEEDLEDGFIKPTDIICITDIRYAEFKKDEIHWLKNELNGTLIHISKYRTKNRKRYYHPPANLAETENNPKLIKAADYKIKWPELTGRNFKKKLEKYVDKFLIDFNIN